MMARLKELEDENRRLKKMYAEERLKAEIIQEAMAKSGEAIAAKADGTGRGQKPKRQHTFRQPVACCQRKLLSLSASTVMKKTRLLLTGCPASPTVSATGVLVCAFCTCVT